MSAEEIVETLRAREYEARFLIHKYAIEVEGRVITMRDLVERGERAVLAGYPSRRECDG